MAFQTTGPLLTQMTVSEPVRQSVDQLVILSHGMSSSGIRLQTEGR